MRGRKAAVLAETVQRLDAGGLMRGRKAAALAEMVQRLDAGGLMRGRKAAALAEMVQRLDAGGLMRGRKAAALAEMVQRLDAGGLMRERKATAVALAAVLFGAGMLCTPEMAAAALPSASIVEAPGTSIAEKLSTSIVEAPGTPIAEKLSGSIAEAPGAPIASMELQYATQFAVDEYADGTSCITVGGSDRYLLLPEKMALPPDIPEDLTVLQMPLDCVYLAASSAMDFYRELGALDTVRMTSTKESDWSLPEVAEALRQGSMLYVGKYSAPDYELVLSEGADIAIESTMIYHSPETAETLEGLGIPVFVERSSYEPDPLGRLEWIKLYGLLSGHEAEAEAFFERQTAQLAEIDSGSSGQSAESGGEELGQTAQPAEIDSGSSGQPAESGGEELGQATQSAEIDSGSSGQSAENGGEELGQTTQPAEIDSGSSGQPAENGGEELGQTAQPAEIDSEDPRPTVAFFYISTNGYAVVRKPGDYVSKMIALAGGRYILSADKETEENATSTMNMEMESFYEAARDADVLIYNSTIDGEIETVDELLAKSGLLADFKVVQNGNVWCTGRNLFQQTTGIGDMILDLHRVITGETDGELTFLHPVK